MCFYSNGVFFMTDSGISVFDRSYFSYVFLQIFMAEHKYDAKKYSPCIWLSAGTVSGFMNEGGKGKFHELYQSDVYLHLTRIRYFCCV